MKIGFISDCHIGYRHGKKKTEDETNLREQDGLNALEECFDAMIKNNVDIIIIAGDLFDYPSPKVNTIIKTQRIFEKVTNANIPIYIITGNHDTSDIKNDYSASVLMHNPQLNVYSYQQPLVTNQIGNVKFWFVSHQSNKEQENTFNKINLDENNINILVTHGSCFDDNIGVMLQNPQEPREIVIPEKILQLNWNYILMGHIHERGWVHSKDGKTDTENRKQYYGGSLIRRGFADKETSLGRGWTEVIINEQNKEIELIPHKIHQRPQYEIFIECKDKPVKDINNEFHKKVNNIQEEELPILKVIFKNISSAKKKSIDLSIVKEKQDDFLSFSIDYQTITNEKIQNMVAKTKQSNNDLLSDYRNFWQEESKNIEENIQNQTKEKTENYIKTSINSIAEKED